MFHIVYETTNKINGKIYVGKHSSHELEDDYLGSGKYLLYAIKKYGRENFSRKNLYVFHSEEEALKKEKEIVTREFCKRKDVYNLSIGGNGNESGKFFVKDQEGNLFYVTREDERFKNGEVKSVHSGKSHYKDKEGKIYYLDSKSETIKKKNLVGIRKGKVTVKDKKGSFYSVSTNDPRYLSGELVGQRKNGRPTTKGRIGITDGRRMKFISKDEKIPEGWRKGSCADYKKIHRIGSTINRRAMNKNGINKFIKKEEIEFYEGRGWKLGKYESKKENILKGGWFLYEQ